MPWWAAGYFGLYLAFASWSLIDDYRNKEPVWLMAGETVADISLLVPALAFWMPSGREAMQPMLLPSFAIGAVLLGAFLIRTLRKALCDPELDTHGKVFVATAGSMLVVLVSAPMLLWGFRAAVLGAYVDA